MLLFLLTLFPQPGIFHLSHFSKYLLNAPGPGPGNGVSIDKKKDGSLFSHNLSLMAETDEKTSTY